MTSFALNLVIATIWLLLRAESTVAAFGVGFLIGFALIAAFRRVLDSESYVRRCSAFVRFLLIFIKGFLAANLNVAAVILFRSIKSIEPNFITYDVSDLNRHEILFLSYCISLTPGTTTIHIEDDFKTLILHALDAPEPERIRRQIDQSLKTAILRFTR